MKKMLHTIFLFLLSSILTIKVYCQPPDPVDDQITPDEIDPCESVKANFTYNFSNSNVINLDCPNKSTLDLEIIKEASLRCYDLCNNYKIIVKFNGQKLNNAIDFDLTTPTHIRLDPLAIASIYTSQLRPNSYLTIELIRSCLLITPEIITFTIPIQFVHSGDTYNVTSKTLRVEGPFCEPFDPSKPYICCNNSKSIIYTVKKISSTATTVTFAISTASLSKIVTFNFATSSTVTNQEEGAVSYTLKGSPVGCTQFGHNKIYEKLSTQKYISDCDDNTNDVKVGDPVEVLILKKIELVQCTYPSNSECVPIVAPVLRKKNNLNFNQLCNSDIEISNYSEGQYEVEWTGQNGFVSYGNTVLNLPLGKYKIKVSNECCESITTDFINCDNPSYSFWTNKQGAEWCRTVGCDEVPTRNACNFEECVISDQIENSIVDGKCIQAHFYKGEILGTTMPKDPEIIRKYDSATKICTEIILCNGTKISEKTEAASFGPWAYNNITNTCSRVVMCFQNPMENEKDLTTPVIHFNNQLNLCEPLCDNIPQPHFIPVNPGFWNWSQANGCTKLVTCSITENPILVNGQPSYPLWSYNQQTELCESPVYCDNIPVGGATKSEIPNSYGNWASSTQYPCYRVAYCGINNIPINYDYGIVDYLPTNEPCPLGPFGTKSYIICDGVVTQNFECTGGDPTNRTIVNSRIETFLDRTTNTIHLLNLNSYTLDYIVFDISGRTTCKGFLGNEAYINLSDLDSGIFFLRLSNPKENIFEIKKFVNIK